VIAWLVPLVIRAGVPSRFAKVAAWLAAAAVIVGLCVVAVAVFRGWIADGKQEAVATDRALSDGEIKGVVINAERSAQANQQAVDDAFENSQARAQEKTDEATRNRTSPLDALFRELH
jgi:anti-sigma factor RsiW